jgi:hypothetical protein
MGWDGVRVGNKEVRVLGWDVCFYLRAAIFNLSAVCFLLIVKVEFVSFNNSAGSISRALFFSQNFISSFYLLNAYVLCFISSSIYEILFLYFTFFTVSIV